jgi:hypothetical protein
MTTRTTTRNRRRQDRLVQLREQVLLLEDLSRGNARVIQDQCERIAELEAQNRSLAAENQQLKTDAADALLADMRTLRRLRSLA